MSIKEAYDLLGLTHPATLQEVKVSFRRLTKKYHPDVNEDENATKKFQDIYEAYEVILGSLGTSTNSIESELRNDLAWFYEWHKESRITPDMDPFEVQYKHFWMPKIAKMLENLKKQKMKNETQ